jgi:cyclopropane fatty-acyl-phospholipid synthase-like methyltransferase
MNPLSNPWDDIFKQAGKVFTDPHEDMPLIVRWLKEGNAQTVLDLGSGTGRHVVYLAKNGFSVHGLDHSPEGISITRQWLSAENLSAHLRLQSMTDPLPYEDEYFDGIISVQVIHHAEMAAIRRIIREVARVLKKNGVLFVTVPTVNHHKEKKEIEPSTFIPLDGPEKGLPHHYFTPEELRREFGAFEVEDIHVDSVKHYCLLARKR